MKELTHEDWMKNPAPRMMWVWDNNEVSVIVQIVVKDNLYVLYYR